MITIIAKFNVLNGSVDEFKKCAVNVVRDTRNEKGNLAYKIYQAEKMQQSLHSSKNGLTTLQ